MSANGKPASNRGSGTDIHSHNNQSNQINQSNKIKELEKELIAAQEHLQTVIKKFESSHEILQCSNEELESSNDQMLTANERLVNNNDKLQTKTLELEKTSVQLMNIKNSLEFPLVVLDDSKKIVRANRQARDFFKSQLVDEFMGDYLDASQDGEKSLLKLIDEVLKTEHGLKPKFKIGEKDFILHITPYRNSADKVEGVILSFFDNTKEEKRRRELLESQKKAHSASVAKTEFLASMSHEIRTPLNAIHGVSDLLRSNLENKEKREELLKVLENSAYTLKELLDDILDFSKLEAGQLQLECSSFSLKELIDRIATVYSVRATDKNLKFSITVDPEVPESLMGDQLRLHQIISNLLSNAIKFTEKGEISLRLKPKEIKENDIYLIIEVQDSGVGIPKEKLELIFDKFTQADTSISRRYGGTGLGLSIVKELVHLMKGNIEATSHPGEGSTFQLCLNLTKGEKLNRNLKSSASRVLFEDVSKAKKHPILVVEDNAENQLLIKMYLQRLGCVFDVCSTVDAGLKMLSQKSYSVVLLDIQVGEKTGFDFMDSLNEKLNNKEIETAPIILALTAHVHEDIRRKCLEAGMNGYLGKPLDTNKLRETLAHYLLE